LGATGGLIFQTYFLQIALLSAIGVALGLMLGVGLPLLFAAAAVTGFGFILGQVALQSLVGTLGEGKDRTRNFNNYALIVAVADFTGPVLAGFSIDHFGHVRTYLVLAFLAAAAVVTVFVLAKRVPRHRRPAPRPEGQRMSDLFRDVNMRRVLIAGAVVMTGIDLFQLYMPLYGHQVNLSASAIGMILGAAAAATFVSRALLPQLVSRYGEEKTLLYSLFLTASMFILIPLFSSAVVLGMICFTLGLGMGLGQPLTVMLCYRYSPAGRGGESLGLRIAINNSMHVVVPSVFGAVGAAFGLAPVFWVSAGVIAAGNWYARKSPA
jgi:predicted MFS family arabinose efflux permease